MVRVSAGSSSLDFTNAIEKHIIIIVFSNDIYCCFYLAPFHGHPSSISMGLSAS